MNHKYCKEHNVVYQEEKCPVCARDIEIEELAKKIERLEAELFDMEDEYVF